MVSTAQAAAMHRTVSFAMKFFIFVNTAIPSNGKFENKMGKSSKDLPMVGVSGFEPEASWTRTKRDTKLRHTPISLYIIMNYPELVKASMLFSPRNSFGMRR